MLEKNSLTFFERAFKEKNLKILSIWNWSEFYRSNPSTITLTFLLCNFPVDILLLFVQETNWSSIQMQHLSRFFFTNKLFNILFSIIEYTNIYTKSWSSVAGGKSG